MREGIRVREITNDEGQRLLQIVPRSSGSVVRWRRAQMVLLSAQGWRWPDVRIAIVMDNFSPHLSTKKDNRVGDWAKANNVDLAYVPTNASWLNRIEAQFQALRYFTLDGTDHRSHEEQNSMIRRYIAWRNRNAHDKTLRELVKRANVA